jgi:tetratricopeptide (TPR) repeat protein
LADCYQLLGTSGAKRPTQVIPKAEAAALQALRIDDGAADAHFSLANAYTWYDWNFSGTEREFRRGLELNPNYPLGRTWYSLYLSLLGRYEDGVNEQKRALELDPMSLIINANMARAYYFARRYDEAIAQAKKTLEMDRGFKMAVLYLSRGLHSERNVEGVRGFSRKALDSRGRIGYPSSLCTLGLSRGAPGNLEARRSGVRSTLVCTTRRQRSRLRVARAML